MPKDTWLDFLKKLDQATRSVCDGRHSLSKDDLVEAIRTAGLPIPDENPQDDPIFTAVNLGYLSYSGYTLMVAAETAWQHYQALPPAIGGIVHALRSLEEVAETNGH